MNINAIICCILIVPFGVGIQIVTADKKNFTKKSEQLRIAKVITVLSNTKHLRQLQKSACSGEERKNGVGRNVVMTKNYTEITAQTILYKDCQEIYEKGYVQSYVYPIWTHQAYKFVYVYCDMAVLGVKNKTGWITIQRRINGKINFDRGWQNYVDGFGNVRGEYWIGLENMHTLTNQNTSIDQFGSYVTPPRMRIDFEDQDGISAFAEYDVFRVAGAKEKYQLVDADIDQATALPTPNNGPSAISTYWFSTYDNNNGGSACPQKFNSGWWFLACGLSNLNGLYPNKDEQMSYSNIYWYYWYIVNKNNTALKTISMKFQY